MFWSNCPLVSEEGLLGWGLVLVVYVFIRGCSKLQLSLLEEFLYTGSVLCVNKKVRRRVTICISDSVCHMHYIRDAFPWVRACDHLWLEGGVCVCVQVVIVWVCVWVSVNVCEHVCVCMRVLSMGVCQSEFFNIFLFFGSARALHLFSAIL